MFTRTKCFERLRRYVPILLCLWLVRLLNGSMERGIVDEGERMNRKLILAAIFGGLMFGAIVAVRISESQLHIPRGFLSFNLRGEGQLRIPSASAGGS